MGPSKHLKYSSILAGLLYLADKDLKKAITMVLSGTLVDLDHLYEYYDYVSFCEMNNCPVKQQTFEAHKKLFFSGEYFNEKKTVKVMLHSWEFGIFLVIICLIQNQEKKHSIFNGFTIGYLFHLILDMIGNNLVPLGYFELYRYLKHWNQEILTRKDNNIDNNCENVVR